MSASAPTGATNPAHADMQRRRLVEYLGSLPITTATLIDLGQMVGPSRRQRQFIANHVVEILTEYPEFCLHRFKNEGSVRDLLTPLNIFLMARMDFQTIQKTCSLNPRALLYPDDSSERIECPLPLHLAIDECLNTEVILYLANQCPTALTTPDGNGRYPFQFILPNKDFFTNDIVRPLVELAPEGLDGYRDSHGNTALGSAIIRELDPSVVRLLVDQVLASGLDHLTLDSRTSSRRAYAPPRRGMYRGIIGIAPHQAVITLEYARELVRLLPQIKTIQLECDGWTPKAMDCFLQHLQSNRSISEIQKLTLSFGLLGGHNKHLLHGWCEQGPGLKKLHLARCRYDLRNDIFINDQLLNAVVSSIPSLEEFELDARIGKQLISYPCNASVQGILQNSPSLKSLVLWDIECNPSEICQVLEQNTQLHTLIISTRRTGPEMESTFDLYLDLLKDHNTTLQKLVIKNGGSFNLAPTGSGHPTIDYYLTLNQWGRMHARNSTTTLRHFVNLLLEVSVEEELHSSVLYGLLRELPELWCQNDVVARVSVTGKRKRPE